MQTAMKAKQRARRFVTSFQVTHTGFSQTETETESENNPPADQTSNIAVATGAGAPDRDKTAGRFIGYGRKQMRCHAMEVKVQRIYM